MLIDEIDETIGAAGIIEEAMNDNTVTFTYWLPSGRVFVIVSEGVKTYA